MRCLSAHAHLRDTSHQRPTPSKRTSCCWEERAFNRLGGEELRSMPTYYEPGSTNSCCRSLVGDTSALPSAVGMSSIVLEDHQLLVTSSEEIRCFFYLFRTPAAWWRYMAFGREIPHDALPESCEGRGWHLVTQVLPMGFMAVAQHIHRKINQALKGDQRLASGHQEIRRDRHHGRAPHLFRVYLDNYDELQKVDKTLASMIAGTPSAWTLAVRETYERLGLPRHPKKAVTQAVCAEVQGAWVDGELGHAIPQGGQGHER